MPFPELEHLIPAAVVAGGGLIAWGEMRSKVRGLREDMAEKANREAVKVHFEAVLQRLTRIEAKIDRQNGE